MRKGILLAPILMISLTIAWAQEILSPQEFLGFQVGADRKLADWQQMVGYFQRLDETSGRVLVQELGRTTQDNPFLLVVISEPDTLANLETYRKIQQRLADPRKMDGTPEEMIERGKTIVLITCAIHSTEVASAQMSMEFAYELATGADDEIREILENVILLFVPALNPDGVNIVNHWYWETLGTPAEGTSPPELYHVYAGHDNNRDWYMFTQKETRLTVGKIHNVWHPQIVFDVHQMGSYGARMFVPPFINPIDANVDPILQAEIAELGASLFSALIQKGKKGVVTNALYDAYTPARAYQHYHAGVRILSEAASARLASPIRVTSEQLRSGRNYDVKRPSWNFPVLWQGGEWRLRDIVEYEKIALRAALTHAARYRKSWLRNFYQVGSKAVERTRPYAFVLPPAQRDPPSLYDLLQVLEFGMVEIHLAAQPFTVVSSKLVSPPIGEEGRLEFPADSYVILMQQPYGAFAKTLLEIQHYPELRRYPGGPLEPPYDVTAHTLGIQLGVQTYQVEEPFQASLKQIEKVTVPGASLQGKGSHWLFSHTNNSFAGLVNRLLKKGHPVYWAPNGFRAQGKGFPVGTLMARVREAEEGLEELLEDIPLVVHRVAKRPELAWRRIHLPRIGLYKSYDPSIDEGWTRWILERYQFPYRSLCDKDIREGSLSDYDVIVIAHQDPARLKIGRGEPYPDAYRGGLGEEGINRLREFAASGGTLLFLGEATKLPLSEWNIGARDVSEGFPPEELYIPGSLLRVRVNNRHPIGYGMPEEAAVMFRNNPVFDPSEGQTVVRYSSQDLLLSGWVNGEEHLSEKAGLCLFKLGQGRVILIGFRTQFRAQTRGTYKFLFNSLYYATTQQ
ncbi:MAG: M14 metallopeptidase family protein [Acidobacteriota bacterium]